MVDKGRRTKKPVVKKSNRKHKDWPAGLGLPEDAAAVIWYEDGSSAAKIPKLKEYAPESPGIMAIISMVMTSEKKKTWRKRFVTKLFRDHVRKKK